MTKEEKRRLAEGIARATLVTVALFSGEREGDRPRFIGAYGCHDGVVLLTRVDGWNGPDDGCSWFYIKASSVESVRVAPTSHIFRMMGFKSRAKWEAWCDATGKEAECCVAIVRMRSGAEHNVFGPAEDVASLIWGEVPCPP